MHLVIIIALGVALGIILVPVMLRALDYALFGIGCAVFGMRWLLNAVVAALTLVFGIAAIAGLAVVLFNLGAFVITSGSIWTLIGAAGLLLGMLLALNLTVGLLDVKQRRRVRQANIRLAEANAAREEDVRWLEAIKRDFPPKR